MTRAIKTHVKEVLAMMALIATGIAVLVAILIGQGATLPGWVPVLGSERVVLRAEFASAQAVTPGQGQTVVIAGVQVGEISRVELDDGHAVVSMDVEERYVPLIHPDASMLLRPKTGLNDMVIELDPGVATGSIEEGTTLPLASTQPHVNPDEILASLDGDTRTYLRLLLGGGAEGLGGRGPQLSATLRRLGPTSRDLARIGTALADRRENIRRAIHNFRLITEELGAEDTELAGFVESSSAVLESFARQERAIRATLREFPGALSETRAALDRTARMASEAEPALRHLRPGVRALAPTLRRAQAFLGATLPAVRDQIRPFTRQVSTPVTHLRQLATGLGDTVPSLDTSLSRLNEGLNALAYDPPGSAQSYLFYVPWLNHNTNSLFLTQDAHGPLRRGLVMMSCSTARIAESVTVVTPFLKTLLEATNQPTVGEIC